MAKKSKERKKKKKHYFLDFIRIVATIAVAVVLVGVVFLYLKDTVSKKAGEQLMEYTIKNRASEYGISSEQVDRVLQSIDDSDKDIIENIVGNHLNPSTISEGVELIRNGDEEGLKDFVDRQLSDSEENDLINLYEKYKDRLSGEELSNIADKLQQSQNTNE